MERDGATLWVDPLPEKRVQLILQGSRRVEQNLRRTFIPPIQSRVEALGSVLAGIDFVPFTNQEQSQTLADCLHQAVKAEVDLIIVAGETAIMDQDDLIPNAVRAAGGRVESVGAPVDPGNLLMLAFLDETPIIGAPGCARSPKENVIDWVLPRLLAGEKLRRQDLVEMGAGGLLAEIKERPVLRQPGTPN